MNLDVYEYDVRTALSSSYFVVTNRLISRPLASHDQGEVHRTYSIRARQSIAIGDIHTWFYLYHLYRRGRVELYSSWNSKFFSGRISERSLSVVLFLCVCIPIGPMKALLVSTVRVDVWVGATIGIATSILIWLVGLRRRLDTTERVPDCLTSYPSFFSHRRLLQRGLRAARTGGVSIRRGRCRAQFRVRRSYQMQRGRLPRLLRRRRRWRRTGSGWRL